jgi:hypothetical protein
MASTPVNNQYYPGLIRYLQQKHVYSKEIDGTVDENNDGKRDAPDGKTSAKEWEYFFGQAERYPKTVLEISEVVKIKSLKETEAQHDLAFFYISLLESGKPESAMEHIVWDIADALDKIAIDPEVNPKIKEAMVPKLFSLLESGKPESAMYDIAWALNYIARDPKVNPKIREDIISRLFSLLESGKPEIAMGGVACALANIAKEDEINPEIKEAMIPRFFSLLESGKPEIAYALYEFARDPKVNPKLRKDIISRLFSLLESGKPESAMERIAYALNKIAIDPEVNPKIKEAMVPKLFSLLESGKPESAMEHIAYALNKIALDPEVNPKIKEAMVPKLLSLLESGKPESAMKDIAGALGGISRDPGVNPKIKEAMIPKLFALHESGKPEDTMSNIASALSDIAEDPKVNPKIKEGMVPKLFSFLESGKPESAMGRIALALANIAGDPEVNPKIKEGMVPKLFSFLESGKPESAMGRIALALANIAGDPKVSLKMEGKIINYVLKILKYSNNPSSLTAAIKLFKTLIENNGFPIKDKENIVNTLINTLKTSDNVVTLNNAASTLTSFLTADLPADIKDKIINTFVAVFEAPSLFVFSNSSISIESKNRLKEASGYGLANAIKDGKLPLSRRDEIARKLLAIAGKDEKGELGKFLSSILRGSVKFVSPDVAKEIDSSVEGILPNTPPYGTWFKNKNTLTGKIYFQEKDKFGIWQDIYLNRQNGFKKEVKTNRETVFSKKSNGTNIFIIVPEPAKEKKEFKAEVFESMADPNIDWIIYNGHSGMGAELALSFNRAPAATDIVLQNPKLIQCASCTSCNNYLGRTKVLYPNSQFIGTVAGADSRDGATIFAATLEGMIQRKTWKEIKSDVDSKKHYVPGNYLFPDQPEQLAFLDSDGDGIVDRDDDTYNLGANTNVVSIDTFEFSPTAAEPPAGKLNQVALDISVSFYWNDFLRYFKDIIRYPEGGEFRNKGWFRHSEDKADLLRIRETRNGEGNVFDIEVNVGYSHCSITTLKIMMIYELNKYFSENYEIVNGKIGRKSTPTSMTAEEKLRGFLLSVEVLEKINNATRDPEDKRRINELYEQFIRKYALPANISFALVLDALTADDGPGATRTASASMEKLKTLIN